MGFNKSAILAVLLMISTVLAFSAAASTAEAKSSKEFNLVDTKDVDQTYSFTLADLANTELVALVPQDVLYSLDPTTEVTVHLDGQLHINAQAWAREDALDINAHVTWDGSIELQITGQPDLVFDFKNAQLKVDASVPPTMDDLDLKVNFHINGEVSVPGMAEGIDLSTHVLLKIQDGQITSFKLWLPEVLEDYLANV